MRLLCERFEYYLIIAGLIFSFGYFPFRGLFFNNFIWILIIPLVCISYILLYSHRFTFDDFNKLDTVMYLYFFFGISMTIVGLVMGKYKPIIIEVFAHYYLPCIFYFISRKYTSYSSINFFKIVQLVRVLAIVMIIDIVLEWILYENSLRHFVPWASLGADQEGLVKYTEGWYGLGFDRIGSILTSSKATEMILASFFCFIFPFSLQKIKYSINMGRIWKRNNAVNLILFMILICSVGISRLSNKTAFVSMIIFISIYSIGKLSIKGILLILTMGIAIYSFFKEFISMIFFDNFIKVYYKWGQSDGRTVLEQIFDFHRLLANYEGLGFFDYIFGKYIATGINSSLPYSDASIGTELRLLTSPVYFGFIFTGIVLLMALLIIKYCLNMINYNRTDLIHFLGFSFLGFYFIIFTDIHYPVFFTHGPFELFFILTGALSSVYCHIKSNSINHESL